MLRLGIVACLMAAVGACGTDHGSAGPGETSSAVDGTRGEEMVRAELEAAGFSGVPQSILVSLSSLRKLSDHPIYTMRYVGPYVLASDFAERYRPGAAGSKELPAYGCSLFAAVGDTVAPMFGRNFDWEYSPLLILFLEPETGYRSIISVDLAYLFDRVIIGRLDAVSVEELLPVLSAPSLPFDGMNEKGLAIGMASVDYESGYTADPNKRDVGDMCLMREVLESSATVEEAISLLEGINPVSQGGPNMHYLLADRTPAAALVEYVNGAMHVFRSSADTPWQLGTNFPVVLTDGRPEGRCWRYDRIGRTLSDQGGDLSSLDAMALLRGVSTPITQWSIVYDLAELTAYVVVNRDYGNVFAISLLEQTAYPSHP
jgi:hypothetical protein